MAPFVPLLKQWRKAVVIDYCLNERWQVPVVTGTPGAGADSCHLDWQMWGCSYKRPEPEWWLWVCRGPTDTTQEKERETQTHSHTTGARAGASERSRGGVGADSGGQRLWARAEVIKRTLYGAITDIMTWDTLPALPPPNWEHRQQIKIESNVTRNSHYIVLGPAKQKPRCAESGQKQSTWERLASVLQQH